MLNYTMQLHGGKRYYPIPDGLQELMSDICREVLRAQPNDLIPFINTYINSLLRGRGVSKVALALVDEMILQGNYFLDFLNERGLTRQDADHYAAKIQAGVRGYYVRKKYREVLAANVKARTVREAESQVRVIEFLMEKNITLLQAHFAATKIQSAFRGYKVRKLYPKNTELRWVPAHESWNQNWVWEEFGVTREDLMREKEMPIRNPGEPLSFRELEVNRRRLEAAFQFAQPELPHVICKPASHIIKHSSHESLARRTEGIQFEGRTSNRRKKTVFDDKPGIFLVDVEDTESGYSDLVGSKTSKGEKESVGKTSYRRMKEIN